MAEGTATVTVKVKFSIPETTKSQTTLIVNAKKADVVNNARFEAINIEAIAKNTWTENAGGNVFIP